jgi:type VI secretion system secreted protein VgrG
MSGNNHDENSSQGSSGSSHHPADEAREVAHTIREGAEEAHETLEHVNEIRHARNPLDAVNPAAQVTRVTGDVLGQMTGSRELRAVAEGVGAAGEVFRAARGLVDLAREAAEALSEHLPEAEFSIELHGEIPWRVEGFEAHEALSEVPRAVVTVVAEREGADPHEALGRDGALVVSRRGVPRRMAGVVSRVEHEGFVDGKVRAKLTLVPALWALSQRVDSRIYESKTVKEVVDDVLRRALSPYSRTARWELQRALVARDHIVQYQESDLAFIERLLQEEGISYAVVPGESREQVLFFDAVSALPALEGAQGDRVRVTDEDHTQHTHESLRRFEETRALTPTRAAVRDFDWTRPDAPIAGEHAVGDDPSGRARPTYLHPADISLERYDDGAHAYQQHDATFRATLASQRLRQDARVFVARGNVTALRPGMRFHLEGHREHGLDRGYVVTSVRHLGRAPEETRAHGHGEHPERHQRYEMELRCVCDDLPLRPAKAHRRARIFGPQTATVVTTTADDAQSEHHGRVRVRFHWEREGAPTEAQRCWVRVSQSWAGADYGVQFIPRKGMEVVVHFLEGDPDRPLVTGVVYNGTHPLPFPVEEHATRSGIRTQSTDGQGTALSGHFNELSFEDQDGREEVYLHAQRNLREKVRNDHTTHVLHDHTNTVDHDDTETVGRDQQLTVKHDRKVAVHRDQTVVVKRDQFTRIDNYEDHFVGEGGRVTTIHRLDGRVVNGEDSLRVERSQQVVVEQNVDHAYNGDHFHLVHRGEAGTTLHFDQSVAKWVSKKEILVDNPTGKISLKNNDVLIECKKEQVVLYCGQSIVHVKKDGTIEAYAGKEIKLQSGSAAAVIDHEGKVAVTGSKEVKLSAGRSTMVMKPEEVTVNSGKIKLNA